MHLGECTSDPSFNALMESPDGYQAGNGMPEFVIVEKSPLICVRPSAGWRARCSALLRQLHTQRAQECTS